MLENTRADFILCSSCMSLFVTVSTQTWLQVLDGAEDNCLKCQNDRSIYEPQYHDSQGHGF